MPFSQIALYEVVEAAVEDLAHLEELVQFGGGALRLPFGDGLARDPQQHGELFLGHVALCAQVLQVVSEAHSGTPSLSFYLRLPEGVVLPIP